MHILLAVVDDLKLSARFLDINLDVLHLLTLSVLSRFTDVVFVRDAESVQLLLLLVVEASELVDGLLVLANGTEQLSISLLASEELVDKLLDVRVSSAGPDLLEGLLELAVFAHLSLHFLLEERAPQLLDHVLVHQLFLVLVIAVGRRGFGNFLLPPLPVLALPGCFVFVLDRRLQRDDSLLTLTLLVLDVEHQHVKAVLRLQLVFARHSLLFELFFVDLVLRANGLDEGI